MSFIKKIFESLVPGGWFFLTFSNFNLVNFFKADLHGSFAGGAIHYERLILKEVLKMLPQGIKIHSVTPMDISSSIFMDRLAARLPPARYLSRMMLIYGRKV